MNPSVSASSPLRVALIGFGAAGRYFHAPFIWTTPGLRLTLVVTRDPQKAADVRAAYPDVDVRAAADDVWAAREDLDLVVVAAPNAAHVPLATAAIEAGLPVVVDKPLAVSVADARRVIDLAARRNVLLTVFQNRRYDGDFRTVRRLMQEGALGEPLRFESRFERWRPEPKAVWRESGAPEDGGGLLMDLGSHLIDQALQLFGPVATIYAELDRRRPGVRVDDDSFVALTHASGIRSHLWMSVLASHAGPRFRLLGSTGSYVKYGLDRQEAALRAGVRPGGRDWGEEPQDTWGTVGTGDDRRPARTERGDYGRFYVDLESALRHKTAPPVDARDSVAMLQVLEGARQSAAERRVMEISWNRS